MKHTQVLSIVATSAAMLLVGPVNAQVEIEFEQATSSAAVPSVAQVLNVNTAYDWTAASMVIELDAGSIVQDRFVAEDPPAPGSSPDAWESSSLDVQGNGSTERVAAGLDLPATAVATGPEAFGDEVLVAGGGEQDLGGESLWMDSRRLDLCWYNHSQDDIGWGRIGRFTLSDTAVGTWTLAVTQAQDDRRYVFSGNIINGRMIVDE